MKARRRAADVYASHVCTIGVKSLTPLVSVHSAHVFAVRRPSPPRQYDGGPGGRRRRRGGHSGPQTANTSNATVTPSKNARNKLVGTTPRLSFRPTGLIRHRSDRHRYH